MVILLVAWIYISLLSLVWGNIFLHLAAKVCKTSKYDIDIEVPIRCLIGIAVIGQIAMYLSLAMPLSWKAHALVLIPAVVFCISAANRKEVKKQILNYGTRISAWGYVLIAACIILILGINSFTVTHPDSLAYHAQAIKWMEEFRATPGLVHLRRELGFQSLWFALEAIFSFRLSASHMVFYPGGAVLCWFIGFMVQKTGGRLVKSDDKTLHNSSVNWGPILLLTYALISWTQIRLTAASAGPDFIVSLCILAALHVFLESKPSDPLRRIHLMIAVLFCSTAINIKLSAIFILLLPVLAVFLDSQKNFRKHAVMLGLLVIMCILPLLARNFVATGYLLFPSDSPDFFHPDWKYDERALVQFQHYITSYARFPITSAEAEEKLLLSTDRWFPHWWKNLNKGDQGLLISLAMMILLSLLVMKKIIRRTSRDLAISIAVFAMGILFWFLKAPDPRFGTGFILGLLYCLIIPWQGRFSSILNKPGPGLFSAAYLILVLGLISYSSYRLRKFYEPGQWMIPQGIKNIGYHKIVCNNLQINVVDTDSLDCGSTPVPCARDSCIQFEPRGESISDGFKVRQ